MKWKTSIFLVALVINVGLGTTAEQQLQKLLLPGDHHAEEVSTRTGERWLAYFTDKNRGRLSEQAVTVASVPDFVDAKRMGKRVSVAGGSAPQFLVRSIAGLRPGPIRCAKVTGPKQLGPNEKIAFEFDGKKYTLVVKTWKSQATSSANDTSESNYLDTQEIALSDGKVTQVLNKLPAIHLPPDSTYGPTLLWAGDLDRDGRLDLLLDTSHYDNRSEWTLCLSSGAQTGQFVRKVAVFVTYGC